MARSFLKNSPNFLDDKSEAILQAAANKMATPDFPASSLISLGWFKVVRYGGRHKYMYVHLCREMVKYIAQTRRLREEQYSFYRPEQGNCDLFFWIDMLDGLTATEKETLILYYKGKNTKRAVGEMLGVTKQTIRWRLIRIRERLLKFI